MSIVSLEKKVIVVTGGAGLLGKEFIKTVVRNGGIGVIADFNERLGIEAKLQINEELNSDKVDFVKTDITKKETIVSLISYIREKYNRIDALVNNAYPKNKNYGRHFFDVDFKDFCENVNMHLGGFFLTSQIFSKYFIEQGYGNILCVSSIYGVIAPRFEIYEGTKLTTPIEYAVVKSAIIHFTKYLAKYLKDKNIRVNSICPGGIFDNQPDSFLKAYNLHSSSKGMLDKADLEGTLLFLLSDSSKYINGQNLIIDDGFTL